MAEIWQQDVRGLVEGQMITFSVGLYSVCCVGVTQTTRFIIVNPSTTRLSEQPIRIICYIGTVHRLFCTVRDSVENKMHCPRQRGDYIALSGTAWRLYCTFWESAEIVLHCLR